MILIGKSRLTRFKIASKPGKIKPVPETTQVLGAGNCTGDVLGLSGKLELKAIGREAIVVHWNRSLISEIIANCPEFLQFLADLRSQYQPHDPSQPYPVNDYPYVFSLNSAAGVLAMLLQYFDADASIQKVERYLTGPTSVAIASAAEKLGLHLQYIQTTRDSLPLHSYPALIRSQKHWFAVYGVLGDRIIIGDPTDPDRTCKSFPVEKITLGWSGELWLVEPLNLEPFNLKWFLPAIRQYRKPLLEVLLASFVLQLLGLVTPLATQKIIDAGLNANSMATVHVMAFAILVAVIFEAILGTLRFSMFAHTARRLDFKLTARVLWHLLRLPISFFESHPVGDTVNRVQELENIRQFLTGDVLTVVVDTVFLFVYLPLLAFYSVSLTVVTLLTIPCYVLLTVITTPLLRDWLNETFNRRAETQSILVETTAGISGTKARPQTWFSIQQMWEGLFARYINAGFRSDALSNITAHIAEFLSDFGSLLILWVGAFLVMQSKLTLGELVAFQMLSERAIQPILRSVQVWQNTQQVLLAVDRLGVIMNEPQEPDLIAGEELKDVQGQIEFQGGYFSYPKNPDRRILKNVSFLTEPGKFIGLVGRSGSGKSTIVDLLLRKHELTEGRILIDGVDICEINLESLRNNISVVLDFIGNKLD